MPSSWPLAGTRAVLIRGWLGEGRDWVVMALQKVVGKWNRALAAASLPSLRRFHFPSFAHMSESKRGVHHDAGVTYDQCGSKRFSVPGKSLQKVPRRAARPKIKNSRRVSGRKEPFRAKQKQTTNPRFARPRQEGLQPTSEAIQQAAWTALHPGAMH